MGAGQFPFKAYFTLFFKCVTSFQFSSLYLRCGGGRYLGRPTICPAAPVLNKRGRYASGLGDAEVREGGMLWDCIVVLVRLRCTCFTHLHSVLQQHLYFFAFFQNDSNTR